MTAKIEQNAVRELAYQLWVGRGRPSRLSAAGLARGRTPHWAPLNREPSIDPLLNHRSRFQIRPRAK